MAGMASGVIAGRMADAAFPPERIREMAARVAFPCSDAAGYINGQMIDINGGMG